MEKEQVTISKITDKIKKYEKSGQIYNTNFLDPLEIIKADNITRKIERCFFGGYEEAERKILVIGSNEEMEAKKYVEVLTIESSKKLSHRAILGSLLSLGINRDIIGDIIINENRADIFVIKEMSKFITLNLDKIGREKIKIYKNSYENLLYPQNTYKEINVTVASLRIDAIISVAFGLSRKISAKLIENQKVKLNYELIENSSKQLKVKDRISVRGYGRIVLIETLGETKKDRIKLSLQISSN